MSESSTYTDTEINHLKKTFERFTQGGSLNSSTLKEIYRAAKVDVTDDEINNQLQAADPKSGGKLDFEAFLEVMTKQHDKDPEAGTLKVFEILDTDNDGQVSAEDLKRGVAHFGKSVTDQDIDEMMLSADVDGDGLINYEEFLKIMTPSKVNGQPKF